MILDPVGARYAGLNLELLRRDGRWVIIGLMGGREAQLDLAQLLGKRIQLTGSTLRTRDAEFKAQLIAELGLKVWPLFSAGKLRAQLERTFPIGDAGRRSRRWRATRCRARSCWWWTRRWPEGPLRRGDGKRDPLALSQRACQRQVLTGQPISLA